MNSSYVQFVRFLEEFKDSKSPFEIMWPLSAHIVIVGRTDLYINQKTKTLLRNIYLGLLGYEFGLYDEDVGIIGRLLFLDSDDGFDVLVSRLLSTPISKPPLLIVQFTLVDVLFEQDSVVSLVSKHIHSGFCLGMEFLWKLQIPLPSQLALQPKTLIKNKDEREVKINVSRMNKKYKLFVACFF